MTPLEFPDPALGDLVDRHWVEVVEFLTAPPNDGHEVGPFPQRKVLGHLFTVQGDTMRYCGAITGIRPTEFATWPGDGRSLSVWHRVSR